MYIDEYFSPMNTDQALQNAILIELRGIRALLQQLASEGSDTSLVSYSPTPIPAAPRRDTAPVPRATAAKPPVPRKTRH
jgi:hypothetical protein